MKLKYKFALAVFISGVLIIGLASIIYYVHFFKIAKRRHIQEFQYETAIIANHVNGLLIEKAKAAVALTHTPLLRDALSASNHEFQALDAETRKEKITRLNQRWMALDDPLDPFIQTYLSNPVARYLKGIQASAPNQEYGELFLTNRYGALVAATARLTTLAHAHKYWWRGACEQGRIFLDDRGYDDSVGDYVLGIVVPVYREGELAGALKCNLKILGGVSDILAKAAEHIPDTLQIVRSGGGILYEKDKPPLHADVPEALRQKFALQEQGALLLDSDGPDRFVGFTPVALTANRIDGYRFGGSAQSIDHREGNRNEIWYVVKSRSIVIVQQLLRQTAGLLFAIGCVLSLLFAGISVWIGYRLTRPIAALIDATRDIGKGRFDKRIHPPSRDEVGRLAHAFNQMAEELSRISASREELEQEVHLRTQAEKALRESEERYRTIINNSMVCMALRQGPRLLMVNNAFCEMINRTEEELLCSTPEDIMAMIHPDDAQMIYQRHLDRLADKDVPSRYEYRYIKKDGSIVWVDAFVQTIRVGGRPSQLGMYVDITDRKKAEHALQSALDEKVILLREIHHRVKNNMQVIISLLRMHARKNQDSHLKAIFDECRGRIEAMSLIHEALYQSDEMARIDFRAYLLKLCRNLGHVHGAAGKEITVNAGSANVALTMDQGIAVGMVIAELISNAFKHAFPAGQVGHITVGMAMCDSETVELTVADDGKGLSAEFDMSASRSLGMRLVWGAVTRELGGRIEATSDGGAKFVIRFKSEKAIERARGEKNA